MTQASSLTWPLSRTLTLPACLFIASCGGHEIPPSPPLATSLAAAGASEIDAGNALLVARIAELSLSRFLAYRAMTGAVSSRALALAPNVPQSVACGGTADGNLLVATLSPGAFNVTPQACRASPAVVLDSGLVFIDAFTRSAGGESVAFNTTPNALRITGATGSATVSGNVGYQFARSTNPAGQTDLHTGRLDFSQGGKTDQYRNFAIKVGDTTGSSSPIAALAALQLDITTPRVPVSLIRVITPVPLTLGATGLAGAAGGILLASSMADGSMIQVDYAGAGVFRLRNWDNRGNPVLDVTKRTSDADVIAADAAAAN